MSSFRSNLIQCIPQSTMSWQTNIADVDDIIQDFHTLNYLERRKTIEEEEQMVTSLMERCNKYEDEIISRVEEGYLKVIPVAEKRAFVASSLIKGLILLKRNLDESSLEAAINTMDKALLMGVRPQGWNLNEAFELIHDQLGERRLYCDDMRTLNHCPCKRSDDEESEGSSEEEEEEEEDLDLTTYYYMEESLQADDICVEENPSLSTFVADYVHYNDAVKITNAMENWAALIKWKYIGYLKRIAGVRLVSIQMGDFLHGGRVRLTGLSEYLDDLGDDKTVAEIGYIAESKLLDQEPKLRKDIVCPKYCSCGESEEVTLSVWLGPAQALSFPQKDDKPNILAQVVGRKIVTLFVPSDEPTLYPGNPPDTNISQVDIRNPNYKAFPNFTRAVPLKCSLQPGEMLYIPAGWWYTSESVDICFSVNFSF